MVRAKDRTQWDEFMEAFNKALAATDGRWSTDGEDHLVRSPQNTQLVMGALREAAGACGNVGFLALLTMCE